MRLHHVALIPLEGRIHSAKVWRTAKPRRLLGKIVPPHGLSLVSDSGDWSGYSDGPALFGGHHNNSPAIFLSRAAFGLRNADRAFVVPPALAIQVPATRGRLAEENEGNESRHDARALGRSSV
jgi:hypothetical protein